MRSANPEPESSLTPPSSGSVLDTAPRAPLIVVSGPSAAGKTTVVEKLLTQSKLRLRRAITATTRDPAPRAKWKERVTTSGLWTSSAGSKRRRADAGMGDRSRKGLLRNPER